MLILYANICVDKMPALFVRVIVSKRNAVVVTERRCRAPVLDSAMIMAAWHCCREERSLCGWLLLLICPSIRQQKVSYVHGDVRQAVQWQRYMWCLCSSVAVAVRGSRQRRTSTVTSTSRYDDTRAETSARAHENMPGRRRRVSGRMRHMLERSKMSRRDGRQSRRQQAYARAR